MFFDQTRDSRTVLGRTPPPLGLLHNHPEAPFIYRTQHFCYCFGGYFWCSRGPFGPPSGLCFGVQVPKRASLVRARFSKNPSGPTGSLPGPLKKWKKGYIPKMTPKCPPKAPQMRPKWPPKGPSKVPKSLKTYQEFGRSFPSKTWTHSGCTLQFWIQYRWCNRNLGVVSPLTVNTCFCSMYQSSTIVGTMHHIRAEVCLRSFLQYITIIINM
jgi:hypothetical protein